MNDTDYTLLFSTPSYINNIYTILPGVSYSLTILIFPFYSNVYRKNLAREKTTALFQVTRHFYRILKTFCYLYFLPFIVILLGFLLKSLFIIMSGVVLIGVDNIIILYMFKHNECLLGILAIQRFFLYFFPSTEKYLGLSENGFGSLIRFIYLTPPIVMALWVVFLIYHGVTEHLEILTIVYTGMISFSFFFSIVSSFLYIPILISIRKLSHLSSAQLNKPQRYVLWQLVVMTIVKCISMSSLFFTTNLKLSDFSIHGTVIDLFCFPLVIELTYLGCNKRNLDTLLGLFNNKWIRKIVSLLCRSTLKVAPQQNIYSINS